VAEQIFSGVRPLHAIYIMVGWLCDVIGDHSTLE